jgi:mono/diheme cytochrome c family protein
LAFGLVLVGTSVLLACGNPEDVRPWRPEDHDGEAKAGQVDGVAAPGQEDAIIVSMAWKQNCVKCHGPDGRGNTPEGRMNRVPDITATKATDAELAALITKGRNKMPAFGSALPPKVIDGLVKQVRSLVK